MMTGPVTERSADAISSSPGHESLTAVDDENHKVSFCNGFPALLDDQLVKRVGLRAEHPARVDEGKVVALPLGGPGVGVPGRPGQRRDDRLAGIRDAVEEGGLPHVRAADQHDRRGRSRTFQGHVRKLS